MRKSVKKSMKKILSLCFVVIMVCSLAACSSKKEQDQPVSAMDNLPENATVAQTVVADFTDKANSGNYSDIASLTEDLIQGDYIPFDGATMEVEEGYLTGFTEEIAGFETACMFGPSIGSIPFVGYVFEVKEDVKVEDFITILEDKADLRWNVCTQADETVYTSVDQKVCFVMGPSTFEE